MTTEHTAEDYARAEFARHEDGRTAVRWHGGSIFWETAADILSDADMAADPGWSIVRDAEPLTAREHLDAAWEAAYVPEDGIIPVRAEHIIRYSNGRMAGPFRSPVQEEAHGVIERRLLNPPAPAWHNARIIEMGGRQWARREDPSRGVEWVALSGFVSQCTTAEIAAYGDVTVIVGEEH